MGRIESCCGSILLLAFNYSGVTAALACSEKAMARAKRRIIYFGIEFRV